MGTRSQTEKKPITVIQVSRVALIFAIIGGIYGFFTRGISHLIIDFIAFFIIAFIISYVAASFIEYIRK